MSPQGRVGELDDDQEEEEEERKSEGWKGEDENVKDEDSERISNASTKRNIRDVARKLWLAVEVGDKLGVLKILQSQQA